MTRVETESKYYCMEPEKLMNFCETMGFKRMRSIREDDEYFTDLEGLFIRNRTCLRIRKTDNTVMEITFKGKSLELLGQYSKLENNIKADINEYENYLALFTSLGYYSYVNVDKERIVYSFNNKMYEYNVMIDTIDGIGGFVEFEIIANNEDYKKELLYEELKSFVNRFNSISLEPANEPYRDIVAKNIYDSKLVDKVRNIFINIDSMVVPMEKDFYKKYKTNLVNIFGYGFKWGVFKNCDGKELEELVREYFDNKMFNTNELLAIFTLLNKTNYTTAFITKVNQVFYKGLLRKLNVDSITDDSICYESEVDKKVLRNSIVLNAELKETIQKLLILINEGDKNDKKSIVRS